MEREKSKFCILMFPWLAHGHIFPFLELAKRILKRKNFHIYFCSTAVNLSSIKKFIEENGLDSSIKLAELHLPPLPDLPPEYHTTKNLPSKLIHTLIKAFQTGKSSFLSIISNLKPDLVMYDAFQPWAAKLALSQGIPAVYFSIYGTAMLSFVHHRHTYKDDSFPFPFPAIYLKEDEIRILNSLIEFVDENVVDSDKDFWCGSFKRSCDVVLIKCCRGIEGKYVDYLSSLSQKSLVPVGPLVTDASNTDEESSDIMEWLSEKGPDSVVYISFGSETFLSREEMGEMAKGLELCQVNFIWVIRFPIGESISIYEILPEGFVDRVEGRGILVQGWAPQTKILAHPNTGAFLSHCGWSSIMESIYYGIPVIGMPLNLSIAVDARMVVDLGIGVEVLKDEKSYKGEEISKAIKKVLVEKDGKDMMLKARELSDKMKMEEEPAITEAADHLWQLCVKKNLNS